MATVLEKFEDSTLERSKAETLVFEILDEMSGRRGVLDMYQFDTEIQEEMLEAWVEIANKHVNEEE